MRLYIIVIIMNISHRLNNGLLIAYFEHHIHIKQLQTHLSDCIANCHMQHLIFMVFDKTILASHLCSLMELSCVFGLCYGACFGNFISHHQELHPDCVVRRRACTHGN